MNKNTIILIVVLSLMLITGSFYLISKLDPGEKAKPANEITNIIGKKEPINNFNLIDTDNKIFNLESLKGKYSVIYFGFALCPDVCPYSLNKFKKLTQILDKESLEKLQFIFVSIDPSRDDPKSLKNFVEEFGGEKVIGLTGEEEEINKLANSLKVYYAKQAGDNNKENYYVDHTSFIYLLDPEARLISQYSFNAKPEEMKVSISSYINN